LGSCIAAALQHGRRQRSAHTMQEEDPCLVRSTSSSIAQTLLKLSVTNRLLLL
jgi:hypothetical protein